VCSFSFCMYFSEEFIIVAFDLIWIMAGCPSYPVRPDSFQTQSSMVLYVSRFMLAVSAERATSGPYVTLLPSPALFRSRAICYAVRHLSLAEWSCSLGGDSDKRDIAMI
jgi:hypothetical protein